MTFRYKDYRQRGRTKEMTLPAEEFCRRFLQHVLPPGFVRVGHYGLLANHGRQEKLGRCRELPRQAEAEAQATEAATAAEVVEGDGRLCAACGQGKMRVVEAVAVAAEERREDSS